MTTIASQPAAAPTADRLSAESRMLLSRGHRVLLIGPSDADLASLTVTVSRLQCRPILAHSRVEALTQCRQEHIDLILLDLDLPEASALLDDLNRRTGAPIVVIASRNEFERLSESLHHGAADFLLKPLEPVFISVRIANTLLRAEHAEQQRRDQTMLAQKNRELELLVGSMRQLADRLEEANSRIQRDMAAAARIQQELLPKQVDIPQLRVAWDYRPCDALGGDAMNIFPIRDGLVGFYILDVSGHGVSSALLSVSVTHFVNRLVAGAELFGELADFGAQPARLARLLNRQFPMEAQSGQYFTMIYGVIDVRTGDLRYINAGHPGPALLSRAGQTVLLEHSDFPIGFLEDADYAEQYRRLERGDRLFIFTDGIIEAATPVGASFGPDRLCAAIAAGESLALDRAAQKLMDEVLTWCVQTGPQDDLTLLCLERKYTVRGLD